MVSLKGVAAEHVFGKGELYYAFEAVDAPESSRIFHSLISDYIALLEKAPIPVQFTLTKLGSSVRVQIVALLYKLKKIDTLPDISGVLGKMDDFSTHRLLEMLTKIDNVDQSNKIIAILERLLRNEKKDVQDYQIVDAAYYCSHFDGDSLNLLCAIPLSYTCSVCSSLFYGASKAVTFSSFYRHMNNLPKKEIDYRTLDYYLTSGAKVDFDTLIKELAPLLRSKMKISNISLVNILKNEESAEKRKRFLQSVTEQTFDCNVDIHRHYAIMDIAKAHQLHTW